MSTDHHVGYVKSETHKGVGIIEFFHPQSNSMPGYLLQELAKAIRHAGLDPDIYLIVVKSAGDKTFCSGASFEELSSIKTEEQGKKFFSGFAQVILAMRDCPKFIIGRIQGKCVGGGVGLAAAMDYCFAVEDVEIKLSELSIGIGPFVVGPAVERKIGLSAYSQLAIDSNNWRNAEWAKRKGLFAEVHPTIDDMDEAIRKLAISLVHSSVEAMAELKKITWHDTDHWDRMLMERAAMSGRLIITPASKEVIARLRAKVK